MLAGLILGAAIVIAVLMLAQIGKSAMCKNRYFIGSSVIGLLIAGAIVTIVVDNNSNDWQGGVQPVDSSISLTDMARIDAGLRASRISQPSMQQTSGVATVPSLLTGLQQRLESDPNDARGWALLAQSYAFVGQTDLAEQALVRAVELGLDELDLRQRVESAQRSPHADLSGVALAQALAQ